MRAGTPQGVFSLRTRGSELLAAYLLVGKSAPDSLLKGILASIVALPSVSGMGSEGDAIDRAFSALLREHGVSGVRQSAPRGGGQPDDLAFEDLASSSVSWVTLAVPQIDSRERLVLAARRDELWDAVVLALLELDVVSASAGIRWLSLFCRGSSERALLRSAVSRIRQIEERDVRILLNCAFCENLLERAK